MSSLLRRWPVRPFVLGSAIGLVAIHAAPSARAQERVGFRATITPDTVFVGQQASYVLTVSIPPDIRQRLRRNPVFIPPEARAMLAYELPMQRFDPTREGTEVHTFRRALFPLTPGRYPIPGSQLTYALPQSPSFFSREEERTLRSDPVVLVAIEPPALGRPTHWTGAVGQWRASARVDAATARVGDPFVLTLRVEGSGNATLLPRPAIAIAWADVVSADERVALDSTPTTLAGAKEFSWLVTPRELGAHRVPALDYAYFDPQARGYQSARSAPLTVRVSAGDLVDLPPRIAAALPEAILTLRPALAGAKGAVLPVTSLWLWIAILAPLPWALVSWHRVRPRARRARTPLEELRDPAVGAAGNLRALFDAALYERTGVRLDRATDPGDLAAQLRREGVTPETATDTERLRDALDLSAYARGARGARGAPGADLRERVLVTLRRIAEEARRRRTTSLLILLAGCLVAGTAGAQAASAALVAFSEGQTAFAGRDFPRSRDAFLRASREAPRDPAAWANLGTAAWQAGDTAAAVLGWQRALRLDPLARELRPRLARVRAPQARGDARVWPIPPVAVASLALALWCGAWILLAVRARPQPVVAFLPLVLPGFLLGALALALETRLRATDLVVIATSAPLRALPALGSDAGAVPLEGEVVRVRQRSGVWLRIELEGGRTGWYPSERTYALARD